MSKELATINRHSPIEVTLSDTKLSDIKDNHEKIELFKKLEFKQLLADIDNEASEFEQEQNKFLLIFCLHLNMLILIILMKQ